MNWVEVVDRITPLVFRIYAGNSAGTGFFVSVRQSGPDGINHAIVTTAWHVIEEAAPCCYNANPVPSQLNLVLFSEMSSGGQTRTK
jgi:hypothetical protein